MHAQDHCGLHSKFWANLIMLAMFLLVVVVKHHDQGNLYKKDLLGLWLHRVGIYNGRAIVAVGRRHGGWHWKLSAHNLSPKHETESELGMMCDNGTSSNKATLPKPHQIAPPTRGQASIWTNGILLIQTTTMIFRVNCLEISEAPT